MVLQDNRDFCEPASTRTLPDRSQHFRKKRVIELGKIRNKMFSGPVWLNHVLQYAAQTRNLCDGHPFLIVAGCGLSVSRTGSFRLDALTDLQFRFSEVLLQKI